MLLLPVRRNGQIKPYPSIPRINPDHPRAQGLLFYGYNVDGIVIDLTGQCGAASRNGTTDPVKSSAFGNGIAYNSDGTVYFNSSAALRAGPSSLSWACGYIQTGAVGNFTRPFCRSAQNGSSSPFLNCDFEMTAGTAPGITVTCNVCNTGGVNANVGSWNPPAQNIFTSLLGTASAIGPTSHFYAQGVLQASSGDTPGTVNTNDPICFSGASNASATNTFQGFVFYGALWGRALSASEAFEMHWEPYGSNGSRSPFLIYPEDEISATLAVVSAGGGTTVTTDFGGVIEWLASLRSDAPTLPESLSSVRADRPLLMESSAAVRLDSGVPLEVNAAVSASAPSQTEFLRSMRGDLAAQLETTSAIKSDAAVLTEITAGVRSDASAAIEELSNQRTDQAASLENLGAVQVIGSAAAQLEMLSSFRSDQTASLESTAAMRSDLTVSDEVTAGVVRQSGTSAETLASVQSNASVEVENLGAVAVVGNAAVQLETVGAVSSSQLAAPETTTAMRSDAIGVAEAMVSVSRHAGAAVENVAGVRSDAATAQENSGALAVIVSAGAPIEILASTRTDAGGTVETVAKMQASSTGLAETTAALTSNLPAPLENTLGVKRDSAIQEEVQGGVSVVAGSAVQIEITSRFAAFSAAAIEIVQIAVSTVLRMLSASGVFTGETDLAPGQPQPFDPSVSPGYVDTPNETYRPISNKGVSNG